MKLRLIISIISILTISLISCGRINNDSEMNIVFLHHSTGNVIWNGGNKRSLLHKAINRVSSKLAYKIGNNAKLPGLFKEYNTKNGKKYSIKEITFPKSSPYGWKNYPYDYYNIWVKNAGEEPFMEEPTLEMLTEDYDLIIFKHCFPVSNIKADTDSGDINSDIKTISNYKLQYEALRDKLNSYPDNKFILFTGAVQVRSKISEEEAKRAKDFFTWVIEKWDIPGDNIYLWDLYSLQTQDGLYFKNEYAVSDSDSHPNKIFAERAAGLLFERIIDVIENNGMGTNLTGKAKS